MQVAQAPLAIWGAWSRGRYPFLPIERYAEVFGGRKVRFGACGDPAMVPFAIIQAIAAVARKRTGYTHQWRHQPHLAPYLMASVDSLAEYRLAKEQGWRTFRVSHDGAVMPNEILCPASKEAKLARLARGNTNEITCEKCGLCDGKGQGDVRKDVVIKVHGPGAKNFVALDAIGAAA